MRAEVHRRSGCRVQLCPVSMEWEGDTTDRKKRIAVLIATVVLAGLAAVPVAFAAPPVAVSGQWSWVNIGEAWVDHRVVGGSDFFTGAENSAWTGGFEGTAYKTYTGVFHGNGMQWVKLTINFTGSVLGRTGTMAMEMVSLANARGCDGS